jgi:hypothetical protein
MNILFSSLSGADRTQSQHYARVFQRLGHRVFRFGPPAMPTNRPDGTFVESGYSYTLPLEAIIAEAGFDPDLFLYIEPRGLIPRGLEQAPFPTATILSDVHTNLAARLNLAAFFDHVFLYHRNYLRYFREHPSTSVHWHPYACDLNLFYPDERVRDIDVGFVGSLRHEDRKQIMSRIRERWIVNEHRFYTQSELPSLYRRSKIVLNLPLADDMNFRTFEAMSCGSLLLTRRIANGQEALFREGVHYVAFDDEPELFRQIDYYLTNDIEREQIAAAGWQEIRKHHSLEQRCADLMTCIQRCPEPSAPLRRMSAAEVDRQYAWLYEYWQVIDPGIKIIQQARQSGRSWTPLLLPVVRTLIRNLIHS